ncbi:alpha-ketoglutarate-dependent dioxygenase AlkB [Rhizobiales bacterium RZME27]|uniref:Alpha-ketoglutarate-dependent dioxygenase AlkB n=1 Tax=Endobacterium cereale TaxID=2663029 RepID=A0A6A8A3A1_9HYPH|nr:alpha-ketoglutarate-dependent dioxygenase AlkB [Endobacterium cereale]MEB2845270.1 alpha-ketoglutarate-dependent dioxygenase AlkB [Endobacterium cereale]MQY45229.1 alpha-ketoglutarate-dependent dioxygenase AlkB [Endobacterium cereale]
MATLPNGIKHLPGYLDRAAQKHLVDTIRQIVVEAPLYVPAMPGTGKPMSVRMTNCGPLGWVTDKTRGYRYQSTHPVTGKAWPEMPQELLDLWGKLADHVNPPEACLVNFYSDDAKMGLHQDKDENAFDAPVLSISLGNTCLFRVGGFDRKAPTGSFKLSSGDIVLLGGEGRLAFHGVDRIYPDTSTLLKNGGRINLTLRRVNP